MRSFGATRSSDRALRREGPGEEREIRDALAHLHDLPYLQTHPLAGPAGGGKGLRRALEETLASLNGPGRLAELLRLRYVEALEPNEVWARLSVSKSEYYHAHRRGLAAVASLLREHWDGPPPEEAGPAPVRAVLPTARLPLPLSSFVGREREIDDLRRLLLLPNVRLVTLTGPPGAGKTRLAVVVATQVASAFAGQTVFVPLAAIADAAGVPTTIARALGLSEAEGWTPLESLKRHLRDEHLLLILDNLEQVVAAAPAVAELLSVCPRLVVLGTSREPLGVRGEQQFSLAPLPPGEALRLFVDRARAVQPGFMLAPDNSAAVAEICQRLDGLPLAIELAAARIKAFPPAAIRDRLSSGGGGLTLLASRARDALPHQQTLFDAIAWSYALLEDNEKKLFRRLGLFVGGFEADAAEAVCPGTTWETVASLVDKSLVQPDPCLDRPAARFAMLETIREYALAQLAPAGEDEEALDRHAAYHLDLVESADRDRRGGRGAAWPERLERAQPDLRAVLRRSLDRGEAARALRLAAALAPFWQDRGHYQEGRAWLVEVLDRPTARAPELRSLRAQAAIGAGWLAFRQGDHAAAGEMFDEAIALADLVGDRSVPAEALLGLGQVRQAGGDYRAAEALLEAGLAEYRGLDDALGTAHALFLIGMLASRRAEFDSARILLGESLTLARRAADKPGTARTLGALALLAFQQGDHAGARALYEEGLAFDRELGDRRAAAWRQLSLGRVLHAQGDRAGARRLYEEATATLRELGERTREAPPG